ncbi:MAG: acyl-CoA carboxylase subunit epsilon [Pseudonocardiaceae bacterium]
MSGDATYNPNRHSRVIHIVRGEPSDEELAAVVVALDALANEAAVEARVPRGGWADPARQLRTPLHPGPGAWRNSALPHSGTSGGPASS